MAKRPLPRRDDKVTQKQFRNHQDNIIEFPRKLTVHERVRIIRMDGGRHAK